MIFPDMHIFLRRAAGVTALFVTVTLAGCGYFSGGASKEEGGGEEDKVTPVKVAEAQTSTIRRIVKGEGVLHPFNQATVVPKLASPIRALHVQRGDHVKRGQLLAELEA